MGRYCQTLKSNEISGGEDTRKVPQDDVALVYLYISIKALSEKKKKYMRNIFVHLRACFFFFFQNKDCFKVCLVVRFKNIIFIIF